MLALRGADVDDMEYVEEFNLDPKVAYTPEINNVMLDNVYNENLELYINSGMSQQEAVSKAKRNRSQAKSDIDKLIKGTK